jgi:hypothetical protein
LPSESQFVLEELPGSFTVSAEATVEMKVNKLTSVGKPRQDFIIFHNKKGCLKYNTYYEYMGIYVYIYVQYDLV